jgi:hypothetical protein
VQSNLWTERYRLPAHGRIKLSIFSSRTSKKCLKLCLFGIDGDERKQ